MENLTNISKYNLDNVMPNILGDSVFWEAIKIAEESIIFSNKFKLPENVLFKVSSSLQDILASFYLRSRVYEDMDYGDEFKGVKKGLEFDIYDKNSATLIFRDKKKDLIASSRIIFDIGNGLQSEKYADINFIRKIGAVAELSRMVVEPDSQKKALALYQSLKTMYQFGCLNNIENFIFSVVEEHEEMYKNLGVDVIEREIKYGELDIPVSLLHWNLSKTKNAYIKKFDSRRLN